MKLDAPIFYYKCIQENLHLTDIDQMAALSNALEELDCETEKTTDSSRRDDDDNEDDEDHDLRRAGLFD